MSQRKTSYFRKPSAQQLIGIISTLLINVVLYVMLNSLFAVDLGSGGSVLS